jgi:hypothetical protein
MSLERMSLGQAVWDTTAGNMELTFISDGFPPYPAGWNPDLCDPLERLSVTLTGPARRGIVTTPTVIRRSLVDGVIVYTKWSWNGTAWGSPVRANPDGTPWTG